MQSAQVLEAPPDSHVWLEQVLGDAFPGIAIESADSQARALGAVRLGVVDGR